MQTLHCRGLNRIFLAVNSVVTISHLCGSIGWRILWNEASHGTSRGTRPSKLGQMRPTIVTSYFFRNCRTHFSKLEIISCPWWKYTLCQWPGRLPHPKLSFAQAAPAHFLTQHPLFGGSPKSATFANIKGWGSTNSPLHPRPLSNIKLVNKAFTSQFACAESLNFELFVAFFLNFPIAKCKKFTCLNLSQSHRHQLPQRNHF